MYKCSIAYVGACEICQQLKSSAHAAAPLASFPVPKGCCNFISMDSLFGLLMDAYGNMGSIVFVGRMSKMDHLAAETDSIDGEGTATPFIY